MKNILYFLPIAILTLFVTTLQAQDFSDPVEYFSYFGEEHNGIINKNMEYVQHAVHSEDWTTIETKRLELIELIGSTMGRVEKVPPFGKDSKMKDEMIGVLEMYRNSFEIEFNDALTLKKDSKESYEAMEKYIAAMDDAEKKLDKASERFVKASEEFAKKNEIELLKNEGNEVVKDLNRLNKYHRNLFLKQFKVSKKNSEFMDALEKQQAGLMEKKRKELLEVCNSTLKVLALMPDFKGDTEYLQSCKDLIAFYKKLGDEGYVKMVEIVRKDEFTQKDADIYNGVIDEYNTNVQTLSNNFNMAGNNLLRKHIPKPIATKRT